MKTNEQIVREMASKLVAPYFESIIDMLVGIYSKVLVNMPKEMTEEAKVATIEKALKVQSDALISGVKNIDIDKLAEQVKETQDE